MDFGSSHLVPSPVSISRSQRTAPSQVAANKLAAGGGASGLWFDHARYDSIYRLLNESITGNANSAQNGALAYGLDPVGNRLSLTSTLAGIAAQTNTFDGN
ncbi:MAG: hypothetical protein K7J46_21490, partial [Bryobacter sp.]|nr:hypothetical protein [Bryobacter sp. CoA8 C33]